MKLRLSLKELLVGVAMIAGVCGWYFNHAAQRQKELAAIEELRQLGGPVAVSSSRRGMLLCGNWQGVVVVVEDLAPRPLRTMTRYLGIDAFQRVVNVDFVGGCEPQLLRPLKNFSKLQAVSWGTFEEIFPAEDVRAFVEAIQVYEMLHPELQVEYHSPIPAVPPPPPATVAALGPFFGDTQVDSDFLSQDPFVLPLLIDQAASASGVTKEILEFAVRRLEEETPSTSPVADLHASSGSDIDGNGQTSTAFAIDPFRDEP